MRPSETDRLYLEEITASRYPVAMDDQPPLRIDITGVGEEPTAPEEVKPELVAPVVAPESPSMTAYDPTIRERLAEFLQAGFESFGMERFQARRQAQSLVGGPSSNLPLQLGVADIVPFLGTGLQTQEAGRMLEDAADFAQRGEYGEAAISAAVGALGLVPGAAGTVKAARQVGKMANVAGDKAVQAITGNPQATSTAVLEAAGQMSPLRAIDINIFPKEVQKVSQRVDKGTVKISNKVTKEPVIQLAPQYRVKVTGAYKPEGKTQNIPNAVNPSNFQDTSTRLDSIASAFPDPLESPERFSSMLATVYNSTEVPIPPSWMIRNANNMDEWSTWFGQMSKNQIDEANRGFSVVDKFKTIYSNGTATADTTGRLMMWAMLSRRASAYPHESGFLDLAEQMTPLIQKAVRGDYTQADVDAGLELVKRTIPEGSPGRSVISNGNDFVRTFLVKMSEKLPDGRTKIQALHDMIADPNMNGPQIRRAFYGLAEDVGIKNKVLSFALLVSGRTDVMVLDRIQINRLFGNGEKIYDDVAQIFDGGPGLAIYEGLERSIGQRVNELYERVGRGDQASLGRYHWESWVLSSGQEVAHPTLDTIVKAAKGEAAPFANVPVMEGRTHKTSYGIMYQKLPDGSNQFIYPTSSGGAIAMTKPQLDELFSRVMKGKEKLVPKDFPGVNFFEKENLPDGKPNPYFGKPWYTWPGVNRERIDELATTLGTRINTGTGTPPMAGVNDGGASNRPIRTRNAANVKRGQAPAQGAK